MIKRFEVRGIHGAISHDIDLDSRLTVLTGRNGSGKTTLLKLLWFLVTPNRGRVLSEVSFSRAMVETDKYRLEVFPDPNDIQIGPRIARYELSLPGEKRDPEIYEILHDGEGFVRNGSVRLRELNERLEELETPTIYFPTFRRIEGGFGQEDEEHSIRYPRRSSLAFAVESFAEQLSTEKHRFVASLATTDIERMLMDVNNDINESTVNLYLSFSREIERIIGSRDVPGKKTQAEEILKTIEEKLSKLKMEREAARKTLEELSALVEETFKDKGVSISPNFILGSAERAVKADVLSAGEKQMLGFLSYNAFSKNTEIIIDEPELSLHVDWQRILFDKLLAQAGGNQFIVATHSPFIYTRYPQNEYYLDADRGCSWKEE